MSILKKNWQSEYIFFSNNIQNLERKVKWSNFAPIKIIY